jgi:hypothetical protein
MFSLVNLYAEQLRRKELAADAEHERILRNLLGEQPTHPLYALGRTLSAAGDRLQVRYGQVAHRASQMGRVSYRFN